MVWLHFSGIVPLVFEVRLTAYLPIIFHSDFQGEGCHAMTNPPNSIRTRIKLSDNEIVEHLARFGYRVVFAQLAFTTETVDDFRNARKQWHKGGSVSLNEGGLLIVEDAQPRPHQKTRDIAVVSLGNARVVMGVEPKKGGKQEALADDSLRRYALAME
jgi:hypothetical protein